MISILGIGTARTRYVVDQTTLARRYESWLATVAGDARGGRRARLVFSRAKLRTRQFAIPDLGEGQPTALYRDGLPTTAERMETFARVAPELAEEACRKALRNAGVSPEQVSTLVVATCTGVGAPDLDVELVERLALPPSVERNLLVWMSCTASFPALRVARRALSSRPRSVALVVCVELCSLHVQADGEMPSLVAHALFADGASAVVIGDVPPEEALVLLGDGATRLVPEGRDALQWRFSDHGFRAQVTPRLPALIEKAVPEFVGRLLCHQAGEVQSWCVHPGGPAILDAVERALGFDSSALEISREVLHALGNMSSATIWYVLERAVGQLEPGALGFLLGFGVGLTLEGLLFQRGGRAHQDPGAPRPLQNP